MASNKDIVIQIIHTWSTFQLLPQFLVLLLKAQHLLLQLHAAWAAAFLFLLFLRQGGGRVSVRVGGCRRCPASQVVCWWYRCCGLRLGLVAALTLGGLSSSQQVVLQRLSEDLQESWGVLWVPLLPVLTFVLRAARLRLVRPGLGNSQLRWASSFLLDDGVDRGGRGAQSPLWPQQPAIAVKEAEHSTALLCKCVQNQPVFCKKIENIKKQ